MLLLLCLDLIKGNSFLNKINVGGLYFSVFLELEGTIHFEYNFCWALRRYSCHADNIQYLLCAPFPVLFYNLQCPESLPFNPVQTVMNVAQERDFLNMSHSGEVNLITPGTTRWFKVLRNNLSLLAKAPKTLNINKSTVKVTPFPHHLIINSSGLKISVLIGEMAPKSALTISCCQNGLMQARCSDLQMVPIEDHRWEGKSVAWTTEEKVTV